MRMLLAVIAVAACGSPATHPVLPTAPVPPAAPAVATATTPPAETAGPPVARTVEVVDHDFGLTVPDEYRWMEGSTNPELEQWLRAQGAYAAKQLARLPGRDRLHARIRELGLGVTAVFNVQIAGGRTFYERLPAGAQLATLVVRDPGGKDRVLVDPGDETASGTHYALNAYSVSPDGSKVAYVTSPGGSEVGTLRVMDVATGKDLPDAIERIWGEGAAAWLPDGKRFFYTQITAGPGEDPLANQVARLHVLGQPVARDATILSARIPSATLPIVPAEWPGLWAPPGSSWVLAFVGGAHSEQRIAVAKLSELDTTGAGKTPWRVLSAYRDGVEGAVVHGDRIYFQSYAGAPNRRILSVPAAHPELAKARVEIAEDPDVPMVGFWSARDAMYVLRRVNGNAQLLRWPWHGKAEPIALPETGWAPDLATDMTRDGLVFQLETWLHPGSYFRYDPRTKKIAPIALASSSTADFSAIAADEVFATSADGTQVPLTILHAKGLALDGSHPALVYGYGAYGASQSPGFSATRLAWLERGGVYAIAHVRGGGERGRRWQDDGSRDKKMNGVHDFIACAQYLVDPHYTTPARLAAQGGSMGGLLVGRVITEAPALFAAANVAVGFVDPLRLLHADNGPNQKAELGDPSTEAGYRELLEMDPYQHVVRTAYPATIFTVGLNDHRVVPWMSAKMAARMLARTTGHRPILIRVDADAGHGHGSTRDQAFATQADAWAFFFAAFGDPDFTPRP